MAGPSAQNGSYPPVILLDASSANLSISHTTGGVAAHFDSAADVEDLQTPVLEMHPDSVPRTFPIHNSFHSGPHSLFAPSFSGDLSYEFDYVVASGQRDYSIDPSQSFNNILSANRSSSTEPWTSLDATGVPVKSSTRRQGRLRSGSGLITPAKNRDALSDSYRDSGIGTLQDSSQHDTRSQLSTPLTEMAQPGPWFQGPMIPSQPEEVNYEDNNIIDLDDDGESQSSPTQSRGGVRRTAKKEENLTCEQCNITVKTPSDLKKHKARHAKDFKCDVEGCPRQLQGFATVNDLNRHEKSVHSKDARGSRSFKCFAPGCAKADKIWPRLDNFKQHLMRMHKNENVEDLLARAVQWYEDENPEDPSQSPAVREALRGQEQSVAADTRRRKGKAPRQGGAREGPDINLGTLNIPPSSMGQDMRFLSPTSAHNMPQVRARPVRSHLRGPQNLAAQRPTPYSRPQFPRQNQPAAPVQVETMTRTMSEAPQPGSRRHTVANTSQNIAQTPANAQQAPQWEQQHTRMPQDMQASQSLFGSDFDPNQFLYDTYQEHGRPHTIADPHDVQDQQIHFMYQTDPIALPNAEYNLLGDDSVLAQMGAGNDTALQSSPVSSIQPHTPTIRLNDRQNTTLIAGSPDVFVQDLKSFLSEHEAKSNEKGGALTREEMLMHARRFIEESLGSRSTLGTPSDVSGGQKYEGPLRCPVKGKTHIQCGICGAIKARQSDLNKHMKRHSRPYGCVLDNCYKSFGSKNDWKRHEQTHPEQKECFRCDGRHSDPSSRKPCWKVFYNGKDKYFEHLRQRGASSQMCETISSRRRVRGNNQSCFWCGFCNNIVNHGKTGTEALNERLRHIDEHFQQEHKKASDWIELGGEGKTKSQMQQAQNAAKLLQHTTGTAGTPADENSEDSQGSQDSTLTSSPEEQSHTFQGCHPSPHPTQQTTHTMRRQLSNPSHHQQQMMQQMWLQQQNTQQRAQPEQRQRQRTAQQRLNKRPFSDSSGSNRNPQGQRVISTLFCCQCEGSWSFALGRCCPMCSHHSCDSCGKQ